jgi:hypothetical protein
LVRSAGNDGLSAKDHMFKVLTLAAVLGMAAPAFGQSAAVPYQPGQGPVTYDRVGKTQYGDDGSQSERVGRKSYGDDGTERESIGGTTYGDDGSKAETIGNQTFIEDGKGNTARCEKIGDRTFCDDE